MWSVEKKTNIKWNVAATKSQSCNKHLSRQMEWNQKKKKLCTFYSDGFWFMPTKYDFEQLFCAIFGIIKKHEENNRPPNEKRNNKNRHFGKQ